MDLENAKAQMRKGVLEMCILAIIGERDTYGKAISDRLKVHDLIVVEGTLYPLLTRLKNDGLVDYFWQESTTGPPRKYLKITPVGKQVLDGMTESWQQLVQSINDILHNGHAPGGDAKSPENGERTAETPVAEPEPASRFFED